jgi:hypothetical protein
MGRINEVGMPEGHAGRLVGVEGVDAVVGGGYEDGIVLCPVDRDTRDPKRLRVNHAVNRAGKELAKRCGVNVGFGQGKFMGVAAIARQVVMPGKDAGKIRNYGRDRSAF